MTFDHLFTFEDRLAKFTGAAFAVVTDGATHAIELAMRYDAVRECKFTCYTYLSVVQLMHQLGIDYRLQPLPWTGEYQFLGTRIWDSARRLERQMFRSGQVQCLSFGYTKPLYLGKIGAILTDDPDLYDWASRARSDGRDLKISPWENQQEFGIGWHYCPSLELCAQGAAALESFSGSITAHKYPDCRNITIE
jgi:dTDP-4-amino-4,6-dideoxygalactose transaminase